ncbi:MAG: phosphoenolpyruvate--protein phosphotransferase [Ignavibacteria bacterium]
MHREKTYYGIPASPGISVGRAYLYLRRRIDVNEHNIPDNEIENEINSLKSSIEYSKKELEKVYKMSVESIGEEKSAIFQSQLEVLNDQIFIDIIISRIRREKKNAASILNDEFSKLMQRLIESGDDYLRERMVDFNDIKNRLIRNLKREKLFSKVDEGVIVFAHELTPADTILFSRRKVKGYGVDTGGLTSHTAIISRALRIPAVVGMKVISRKVMSGDLIIIDGYEGIVIVNPTKDTLEKYREKQNSHIKYETKLSELINQPCVTKDCRDIELSANIEFIDELEQLAKCGYCGIGLYRTEHMYMAHGEFPTEEEQKEEYTHIANVTFPKTVTIRTFDLGGDKVFHSRIKENNPNLGWRGIRILLSEVELFKTQLRAILRSSIRKNVRVMFPMIVMMEEIKQAKKLFEEVRQELDREGIVYDRNIKVGMMVETPASVILSDEFAKEVDFFSIGTNDLTQYLLAVDRDNELISNMYQQLHPSVLRSLKVVVNSAQKNNIPVSICGELASIPYATPILVGLGFNELSVNPVMFAEIKKIIRNIEYNEAKDLTETVLCLTTEQEVIEKTREFLKKKETKLY